jgi:hypothetical protein
MYFQYIFLPPFLFPPRGKRSTPSHMGEGWDGGQNKYIYNYKSELLKKNYTLKINY